MLRRWISVTLLARLVRKIASSTAVLPPPTIATLPCRGRRSRRRSRRPRRRTPRNFCSLGSPSQRAWAPVQMISVSPIVDVAAVADAAERPAAKIDVDTIVSANICVPTWAACAAHLLHQPGTLDHLGEARIVFDIGGDRHLAAGLQALDQDRLGIGARGIDRRRVARRSGADDQNLGMMFSWHGVVSAFPAVYRDVIVSRRG